MNLGSAKSFSSVSQSQSGSGSSSGSGSGACSYSIGGVQLLDPNTGYFIVTNTGPSTIAVTSITVTPDSPSTVVTPNSFSILSGEEVAVYVTSYVDLYGAQVDVFTSCGNTSFNFPSA